MVLKNCSECDENKEYELFCKNKQTKDGFNYFCKVCQKIKREQSKDKIKKNRIKNKDKNIEYQKEYRLKNNEILLEKKKEYYDNNKEIIKEYKKQHYLDNIEQYK